MRYDVHIHEGGGAMKEKPVYKSQCYCINLRRAANAVTDYYDAVLKDLGVSVSQFSLLLNLARMETANTSELAERVNLDRSTLVRNLKPLLERGLILDFAREGARSHKFAVSETGQALLEKGIPQWEHAQETVKDYLSPEDTETLLRLLRKLHELSV